MHTGKFTIHYVILKCALSTRIIFFKLRNAVKQTFSSRAKVSRPQISLRLSYWDISFDLTMSAQFGKGMQRLESAQLSFLGGGKVIKNLWYAWQVCDKHHKLCDEYPKFVMSITNLWYASQICDEHHKLCDGYHKFVMNITNIEENTKHVGSRWKSAR